MLTESIEKVVATLSTEEAGNAPDLSQTLEEIMIMCFPSLCKKIAESFSTHPQDREDLEDSVTFDSMNGHDTATATTNISVSAL